MSGSGDSNVGNRNIYEAGDQRNYSAAEMHEKERLGEGKSGGGPDPKEIENQQYKQDPTLPARSHGNEPSKGAKIDAEIKADEEELLRRKGKA